ncbi:MAG: sulfotransferase domain-containing protein [Acidimicrobiales bacterium]
MLLIHYPKSGSTWLRFMLSEAAIGVPADFESIADTFPPAGRHEQAPRVLADGGRLVHTHEPPTAGTLSKPGVTVYLLRDCRDVIVSYFFHLQRRQRWDRTLSEFVELFLRLGPDHHGTWASHVDRAFRAADRGKPVCIVKYEELVADPSPTLRAVLDRIGLTSAHDLDTIVDRNSIAAMRSRATNPATNMDKSAFVRRGSPGDWQNHLSAVDHERIIEVAGPTLLRAGYAIDD